MLMDEVRGEAMLRKIPLPVMETLTPDQVAAIRRAAGDLPARRHPIDRRISFRLPLLGGVYLVLLVGKEKRSPSRINLDKRLQPTDRFGGMVLVILGAAAFLLIALIGILFENAVFSQ